MPTRPQNRRAVLALPTILAILALAACSGSGPDGADNAPPDDPPAPAATGTGPYPKPTTSSAEDSPRATAPIRPPHGGIPVPASVDQEDASAVARGALIALHTYDTDIDPGRQQAALRMAAVGWTTAAYAAQQRAAQPRGGNGAAWNEWTRHRAYTTATATPADEAGRPADTATTAYRQWTITITPHGRDGWTGEPEMSTAFVELSRPAAGKPWRLSALQVQ
ncbi:hypothetical protein AB0G29_35340 [Streptomyces parvus]|uniref:hypothetical protein n=1 Tax=Streptomyces parvus TaxID=66428 RepID=UPI0033C15953